MRHAFLFLSAAALVALPAAAHAQDTGLFAGVDVSTGIAGGSSDTTDGGAPFAGGGVVEDVDFGQTLGIGGHIGYKFNRSTSISLNYQHVRGDISWRADFPLYGVASDFEGKAVSDTIMANLAYEHPLSDTLAIRASAGGGVAFNRMSNVVETDVASGQFLSDVASRSRTKPVGQLGAGFRYKVMPNAALGLDAIFAWSGGYETGNTRSGNLGITDINPYRINDVWRASLGASFRYGF